MWLEAGPETVVWMVVLEMHELESKAELGSSEGLGVATSIFVQQGHNKS